MKVMLRNPRREVEVAGNRRVKDVLRELEILPETVLVIRGDELITADQVVADADAMEAFDGAMDLSARLHDDLAELLPALKERGIYAAPDPGDGE